jgi:hypothetical protein
MKIWMMSFVVAVCSLSSHATEFWFAELTSAQVADLQKLDPSSQVVLSQDKDYFRWGIRVWPPRLGTIETKTKVIIQRPDGDLPAEVSALGFQRLESVRMDYWLSRVSDINGYGTQVNGEARVRMHQTYSGPVTQALITLANNSRLDPLLTFEKTYGDDFRAVVDPNVSIAYERGYVLRAFFTLSPSDRPDKQFYFSGQSEFYRPGVAVSFVEQNRAANVDDPPAECDSKL